MKNVNETNIEVLPAFDAVKSGEQFRKASAALEQSKTALLTNLEQAQAHMIHCGNLLNEAKAALRHGEWLDWLKDHARIHPRTAQKYMKLASLGNANDDSYLDDKKVVKTYEDLELIEEGEREEKKKKAKKKANDKPLHLKIKGLVYKLWEELEKTDPTNVNDCVVELDPIAKWIDKKLVQIKDDDAITKEFDEAGIVPVESTMKLINQ